MVTLSTPSAFLAHDNHTPGVSFAQRVFSNRTNFLMIRNTDATNSIKLSFDGVNGFTIRPGELMTFETIHLSSYWTLAVSGSPAVEVLYGSDRSPN